MINFILCNACKVLSFKLTQTIKSILFNLFMYMKRFLKFNSQIIKRLNILTALTFHFTHVFVPSFFIFGNVIENITLKNPLRAFLSKREISLISS